MKSRKKCKSRLVNNAILIISKLIDLSVCHLNVCVYLCLLNYSTFTLLFVQFVKSFCWVNTWFPEEIPFISSLETSTPCLKHIKSPYTLNNLYIFVYIWLICIIIYLFMIQNKVCNVVIDIFIFMKSLWRNKCEKYWNKAWKVGCHCSALLMLVVSK